MAKWVSVPEGVSATTPPHVSTPKPNPFTIPEDEIKKQIFKAHVITSTKPFDADSLFVIVENILNRSTQIVDDVLKGYEKVPAATHIEEMKNVPASNIVIPVCILKELRSELTACPKDSTPETAHETGLRVISSTLSDYSWEAMAVLILAAFASEFGDFWLLVQLDKSNHDQLSRSLAILKGTPSFTKTPATLQAHKAAVDELNSLIRVTLKLMETLFELEKLSTYFPREIGQIPKEVDMYWVILTVFACAAKVSILTSEEDKQLQLSPYVKTINTILKNRTEEAETYRQMKNEQEAFHYLVKISQDPQKGAELIDHLFLADKDSDRLIIDGGNNYKKVGITEIEKKTLFLLISHVDISVTEINVPRRIQLEKIEKDKSVKERYGIVWMPIVDDRSPDYKQRDFESQVKTKYDITWYIVKPISHKAAVRFVKEEWKFTDSPIVLVYDVPTAKVLNHNASYALALWGLDAFPFDEEKVRRFFLEMKWIVSFFKERSDILSKLISWGKKESYIFFHGGRDKTWANEIEVKTKELCLKINQDTNTKLTIKTRSVEEDDNIKEIFWKGVENLFITTFDKSDDFAKHQIQRLYSYKNDEEWFALNKGETTIIVGNRMTFLKVLEDFDKVWAGNLRQQKPFEVAFIEYHEKMVHSLYSQLNCSSIELPESTRRSLVKIVKCPECDQDMKKVTSYKCCHTFNHDHKVISIR